MSLRPWVTGLGVLALLTLAVLVVTQQASVEPLTRMRYPAESAGRMVERHFAFYEDYATTPAGEQLFHRLLFGPRDRVRAEGIAVYREVLQHLQRHGDEATSWALFNTQARLLIAVAETGRWPEFDAELARLGDHPERTAVGEALRYAYGHGPLVIAAEAVAGARLVPRGWSADRLNLRIATRVGDAEQARYWAQRLRARLYPVPAALFSALHLYSLTGFLAVFWSGLVVALAFERYRSLLPVMVVHGIGNILALSNVLLFYR